MKQRLGARGIVGRWGATAGPRAPSGARAASDLRDGPEVRVPRGASGARAWWGRVGLVAALGMLTTGCIQIDLLGQGRSPFVETVVYSHEGGRSAAKFVMIEIDGVIGAGQPSGLLGLGTEGTAARVREQLDRARADDAVRGILLRIDSPGGEATASDVIYSELLRFKQERGIPIVADFYGLAASGGYYVAMAADEIVAEPTAVTGSIGVLFAGLNFSGLMQRWGIADQTITAGRFKDAGSMTRPQTPEERAILQGVVDDLFERFRSVVAAGRPHLTREQVDELADGRVYSAPQALANGLIDRIGTIEDAVGRLEARIGVQRSFVVSYHRTNEWRRNLYTRAAGSAPAARAVSGWPGPGFHYIWPPALIWPQALGLGVAERLGGATTLPAAGDTVP